MMHNAYQSKLIIVIYAYDSAHKKLDVQNEVAEFFVVLIGEKLSCYGNRRPVVSILQGLLSCTVVDRRAQIVLRFVISAFSS